MADTDRDTPGDVFAEALRQWREALSDADRGPRQAGDVVVKDGDVGGGGDPPARPS